MATTSPTAARPVLFVDTCALLDVVRAPLRDCAKSLLHAVRRVETALERGKLCLVAAEVTRDEWTRNVDTTLSDVEKAVQEADKVANAYIDAATLMGAPNTPASNVTALNVPQKLRDRAERLLNAATLLPATPDVVSAAYARQLAARRPAQRGKDTVGDCTIMETLLATAKSNTGRPLVFLTSNTKDFGGPRGRSHPDVDADCSAVGVVVTFDWGWAVHELGLQNLV